MPPHSTQHSSSSTSNNSIDPIDNTWDGGPLTRKAWYEVLPEQLAKLEPTVRTMYLGGYYFDRTQINTVSTEHSFQLSISNVKLGTFEKTCNPYALELKDPTKTYALAYQFALAQDTATYAAMLSASTASSTASSSPSSAPPPAPTPSASTPGIQCKILDDSMARYNIEPEKWVERDAQNFDTLNNTIINTSRRQDYRRATGGSCLDMLILLALENRKRQDDIGTWASSECRKILDAGLLSPDTVGFDNYRNAYESANRSKTMPDDEQALCLIYINAVKDLGEQIANRIELKFDADSTADQSMTKTIELLSQIFVKVETKAADTGRALAVRGDAAKDTIGNATTTPWEPPKKWVAAQHQLCTVCEGPPHNSPDDKRRHLRLDCPHNELGRSRGGGKGGGATSRNGGRGRNARRGASRVLGSGLDQEDNHEGCEHGDEEHDYYDETDGVEIEEGDVALSSLFTGGAKSVSLTDADATPARSAEDAQPQDATELAARLGRAAVARHAQPPQSPAPVTPARSYSDSRAMVEQLDSSSPVTLLRQVESELQLGVSTATGGANSRTKVHIINDMRARFGRPPLEPPMGIPLIAPTAAPAPPPPVHAPAPAPVPIVAPASTCPAPSAIANEGGCG